MTKKAIAYTSDVVLGTTGEVISRKYQKEIIRQFAEDNGIEIVKWFEDEMYDEDVLSRSGVKDMLGCADGCDLILVERIWAFSRNWSALAELFNRLDRRSLRIDCATTMWDCVSQMARHRYDSSLDRPTHLRDKKAFAGGRVPVEADRIHAIKQPERLHFTGLVLQKTYDVA